jgi:signal transduction histidine kinase
MQDKLAILVCETLRREAQTVVEAEALDDVVIVPLRARCHGASAALPEIEAKVRECRTRFTGVDVLQCASSLASIDGSSRSLTNPLPLCFDFVVNHSVVQSYLDSGAYLVTPGWLNHWRAILTDWKFDKTTAREFFAESSERIVLLDTGVEPGSEDSLNAFANHVGMPAEKVPVGLDHLRNIIITKVLNWRLQKVQGDRKTSEDETGSELAEHAMMFDVLSQMSGLMKESEVLDQILDLFTTLCAPTRIVYIPFTDGEPEIDRVRPAGTSLTPEDITQWVSSATEDNAGYSASKDGISLLLVGYSGTLGLLQLEHIAYPEYTSRYLNLALGIRRVLALAIENARREASRKQIETELQRKDKLAAIGTLASGAAHEINNPIMGMMGYAQLIQDSPNNADDAQEYAGQIMHEGKRVAAIVRALLDFSQQRPQMRAPVRIAQLIDSICPPLEMALQEEQIALTIDISEDLPQINCNAQQISEVLMALLNNAREALNEKYEDANADKVIRISARVRGQGADIGSRESEVGGQGAGGREQRATGYIRITVEDHGAGIPSDIVERIFEPFFTTKSRSNHSGLSLAVNRTIVQEHGGELSAESKPESWTRVHIDLPRKPLSSSESSQEDDRRVKETSNEYI